MLYLFYDLVGFLCGIGCVFTLYTLGVRSNTGEALGEQLSSSHQL